MLPGQIENWYLSALTKGSVDGFGRARNHESTAIAVAAGAGLPLEQLQVAYAQMLRRELPWNYHFLLERSQGLPGGNNGAEDLF